MSLASSWSCEDLFVGHFVQLFGLLPLYYLKATIEVQLVTSAFNSLEFRFPLLSLSCCIMERLWVSDPGYPAQQTKVKTEQMDERRVMVCGADWVSWLFQQGRFGWGPVCFSDGSPAFPGTALLLHRPCQSDFP